MIFNKLMNFFGVKDQDKTIIYGRPSIDEDVIKNMRTMRSKGVSFTTIAKSLGVSRSTVIKYTKDIKNGDK